MKLKLNTVDSGKLTIRERHLAYLQNHFTQWFNDWANQSIIEDSSNEQSWKPTSTVYILTVSSVPVLILKCAPILLAKYFPNKEFPGSEHFTDNLVKELLMDFITRLQPDMVSKVNIYRENTKIDKSIHATFHIKCGGGDLSMSFFNEVYGWYIRSLNRLNTNISHISSVVSNEQRSESNYKQFQY